MIDFWTSILITFLISLATVFTDWIAGKIIIYSKVISNLRRIIFSGLSAEDARSQAIDQLERLKASRVSSLSWGSDLATVSLSMDFTALGIWIYKPDFFPFFSRFNSNGAAREMQIWFVVLLLHFILLLISVVLKHHQQSTLGQKTLEEVRDFLETGWFNQNKWQLTSNTIGFLTLLSAIVIFTNSL